MTVWQNDNSGSQMFQMAELKPKIKEVPMISKQLPAVLNGSPQKFSLFQSIPKLRPVCAK